MTKQERYKRIAENKLEAIEKAERVYRMTSMKRDKEYLEFLKLRRSRYIL